MLKSLDQSTRKADFLREVSGEIVFIKEGIVEMIGSQEANIRKLETGTVDLEFFDSLDCVFSIFGDIYPEMSIRQAALFVKVAKKEGINHSELTDALNIPQTSVSRNVLRLARRIRNGKSGSEEIDGLDLIENRQDIYKPNKHAVYLTERGQALRESLVNCYGCLNRGLYNRRSAL